jgi:hypothetical protein
MTRFLGGRSAGHREVAESRTWRPRTLLRPPRNHSHAQTRATAITHLVQAESPN